MLLFSRRRANTLVRWEFALRVVDFSEYTQGHGEGLNVRSRAAMPPCVGLLQFHFRSWGISRGQEKLAFRNVVDRILAYLVREEEGVKSYNNM